MDPFDPLLQQVCDREDERVVADPEIDQPPVIVHVHSGQQAEPRPVDWPADTEAHHR